MSNSQILAQIIQKLITMASICVFSVVLSVQVKIVKMESKKIRRLIKKNKKI